MLLGNLVGNTLQITNNYSSILINNNTLGMFFHSNCQLLSMSGQLGWCIDVFFYCLALLSMGLGPVNSNETTIRTRKLQQKHYQDMNTTSQNKTTHRKRTPKHTIASFFKALSPGTGSEPEEQWQHFALAFWQKTKGSPFFHWPMIYLRLSSVKTSISWLVVFYCQP